jgi:polysulfide reductase chain C
MDVERQKTFGWLVAVDLFLAGTGAGVFIVSFIVRLINRLESFPQTGFIVGPILVLFGAILLFVDLGNKRRFYRLITNLSSWMALGTWSIAAFVVFGLAYSLSGIFNPDAVTSTLLLIIGIFALVSAIMVIIYTGFLLYKAKRVPFWNNLLLPVVFLFSSLYTGMALFLIIDAAGTGAPDEIFRAMVIAELALISVHLFTLGMFLVLASQAAVAAIQSVHILLRTRSFILVVLLAGMVAPLGLLLYQVFAMGSYLPALTAGVLLLIGGIYLRHGILKSGIRLSVSHDQLKLPNKGRMD